MTRDFNISREIFLSGYCPSQRVKMAVNIMIKGQTFTGQRFGVKQFTGETLENCRFYCCHFSGVDFIRGEILSR